MTDTQEQVLEGNKLIAEFMGLNEQDYNIDWRILMPVVEEIEGYGYEVSISRNYCNICPTKLQIPVFFYESKKGSNKISVTWQAVVQFIKWYNNSQNKQS